MVWCLLTFYHEGSYVDDNDGATLPPEIVTDGGTKETMDFQTLTSIHDIPAQCMHGRRSALSVSDGLTWQRRVPWKAGMFCCTGLHQRRDRGGTLLANTIAMSSQWLVSELASQGGGRVDGKRQMCIGFTNAFLCGCIPRDVYIEVPDDARKKPGLIARLNKVTCGVREALL